MGKSPYSTLPDHCFWRRANRGAKEGAVDPVVQAGFHITPDMKIATAGSCFAQHIARQLSKSGFNYFVAERAHPLIRAEVARRMNYGTFSARFGNLYTTRQLWQLAQRAYGRFTPHEDAWEHEGGWLDPYRPNIQPGGFVTLEELHADRAQHFAAVRTMLEECDVFVFTFGLTEAWRSKVDGAVFPLCPGTAGGTFDPGRHEFVNFTVDEVVADFSAFTDFLLEVNPDVNILMTVSPVPLMATARADTSVIVSTAYSKAVLRVATEMLAAKYEEAFYFPSYEVITGNHAMGRYFEEDLREVHPAGVAHVMRLFMKHYCGIETGAPRPLPARDDDSGDAFAEKMAENIGVICDEELLDQGESAG
ncbi:GSCFA domain-containing protein [Zhengella sp. ZM62]|uniref:GSCFA domain-containing protein n=1 Tax=Zhengella sedimenti TaxID=3390035 RepID=UPI003975F2F2